MEWKERSTNDNLAVRSNEPERRAPDLPAARAGREGRPGAIPADTPAELHERGEILELLSENLPAAIAYIDNGERYRLCNRIHAEWLGRRREQILGRTVGEVLDDEAYRALAVHVRTALRGRAVVFETSLPVHDGSARYVRVHYVPHRDESRRRVTGFFALAADISDAKRIELNERPRLLELAHAARLSLVGEMTGELTHELAQPLAAIANYGRACGLLLEQNRLEELRDITQKVGTHAERALAVVQSLRRFLRKEHAAGRTDVHAIVREALALVQWEADARGVPLRFESTLSLSPVRCDHTLIEQVVLNLVRNALDAVRDLPAKECPIVVTVGTCEGAVEVAVQDRGPGLTPEAKARLFEPFFTTKHDGLGIGLAICRRIIESHGGRLWAEDNPDGAGATFRFTVPNA